MSPFDPEQRDLDFFSAGAPQKPEPQLSWGMGSGTESPPAAAPRGAGAPPFETDAPAAPAQLALPPQNRALLERAADLMRRADAPSPFAVGLLAPAGGGKTSALRWLTDTLARSGATVVTLRAGDLANEPERALAAALFRALSPSHAALANEAAQEGAHRGADAGALARAAHEKLDALRRKLMSERQNLSQTEARRAALVETQLYDTPGSRVDAFTRRMRAAFEPRLRRFGFAGDPLADFKDLTRDLAETGGFAARVLQGLRAVYAYRGQVRLLVFAAVAFELGRGAAWLAANRTEWLDALAASSSQGAQAKGFLQGHIGWLPQAAVLCGLLGLALLALNLWRAFSFMQPLVHAAGLLDEDVAAKGHELDQTLAHQARNVDLIGAETAAIAQHAAEAERRAAAAGAPRHPPAFLETDAATQKREFSRGFLESLSDLIAKTRPGGAISRLVVAVDGFESLPQSAALFDRLHDLLARPGFVAVYALDPGIFASSPQNLVRRVQLPLRLDAGGGDDALGPAPLDAPLSAQESQLIEALAPLAHGSPRLQKRLRNLFRFLRPAPGGPSGLTAALALLLAAGLGASPDDRRGLDEALAADGADFSPQGSALLREAFARTISIAGPISHDEARRAAGLVRTRGDGALGPVQSSTSVFTRSGAPENGSI